MYVSLIKWSWFGDSDLGRRGLAIDDDGLEERPPSVIILAEDTVWNSHHLQRHDLLVSIGSVDFFETVLELRNLYLGPGISIAALLPKRAKINYDPNFINLCEFLHLRENTNEAAQMK